MANGDSLTDLLRKVRDAMQNNRTDEALGYMRRTVELALAGGDRGAAGRHLGNLALLHHRLGQHEAALAAFKQAQRMAHAAGDHMTESGLLGNIGNILREQNQHATAIDYLKRALALSVQLGDTRGRGIWLSNLGMVYDDLQQPVKALACHEEAVGIARELRDQRGLATRLVNLAQTRLALERYEEAAKTYQEAAGVYGTLGDRSEQAIQLGHAADIYNGLGKGSSGEQQADYYDRALRAFGAALEAVRSLEDKTSEAYIRRSMGNVYGRMGRFPVALAHLNAAKDGFTQLGMTREIAVVERAIEATHRFMREGRPVSDQ